MANLLVARHADFYPGQKTRPAVIASQNLGQNALQKAQNFREKLYIAATPDDASTLTARAITDRYFIFDDQQDHFVRADNKTTVLQPLKDLRTTVLFITTQASLNSLIMHLIGDQNIQISTRESFRALHHLRMENGLWTYQANLTSA